MARILQLLPALESSIINTRGLQGLQCFTIHLRSLASSTRPGSSSNTAPSSPPLDPFTAQLQDKANKELQDLVEKAKSGGPAAAAEAGEADEASTMTPENIKTGEIGGPKGPEPTRFGDWERGGRCSDF